MLPLSNGTLLLADGGNRTIDRIGFDVPGPPTAVSVAPSESGGQLTFTAPTDPGSSAVTGYEASLDNGTTWVPLTTTVNPDGSLSAPLSSLADGTSYTVLVHAVNASGSGPAGSGSPFVPGETPVISVAPSISGTPAVGTVLSAVPGTWLGGGSP